jgi:hypothetical protein
MLTLLYLFSGMSDGATNRDISVNLLFPVIAFSIGLASCFVERNFMLPCGVLLTGISAIGIFVLRNAGVGNVYWVCAALYGGLWWAMYFFSSYYHQRGDDK